jgi:hypothetical protein
MERPSLVVEKESEGVIAMKGADKVFPEDMDPGGKLVEKGVHV